MADPYSNSTPGVDAPAGKAIGVTPSASALTDQGGSTIYSRGLYVGTGGDLVVTMADGQEVVFYSVPAGTILPIRVSHIRASTVGSPTAATTASEIVVLW